jgi:hypothetical protein
VEKSPFCRQIYGFLNDYKKMRLFCPLYIDNENRLQLGRSPDRMRPAHPGERNVCRLRKDAWVRKFD